MSMPDAAPLGLTDQVDTLYLEPAEALAQARLRARVPLVASFTGLQVCWYMGHRDLPDAPDNCIRLPLTGAKNPAASFLASTRLRWPQAIRFAAGSEPGRSQEEIRIMIEDIRQKAGELLKELVGNNIARLHARFQSPRSGEPLRVMGIASRQSTVMQYVMRAWLAGFSQLGHEIRVIAEPDEMSCVHVGVIAHEMAEFVPHIMLTINKQDVASLPLPREMIHVVWWQDLMPQLTAGNPLAWRERDLVYLIMSKMGFRDALLKTGLEEERIHTQSLLVDNSLFTSVGEEKRERKIIFVGSNSRPRFEAQALLAESLEKRLEAGERLTLDHVGALVGLPGVVGVDDAFARVEALQFAVRRHALKMMCRQKIIPVEIWGRGWGEEPELSPFFKGEVPHGEKLASLYRSATHGVCIHPEIINHSRLGEIAGCGCFPVIYDVRHVADPPFWENKVVYFHDQRTLEVALNHECPKDVRTIVDHFSNTRFAAQIISDARLWLQPRQ